MPSVSREQPLEPTLYTTAELIEHRRELLRHARSFPLGPERNHHLQIALLFRALFKNRAWLDAHTADDAVRRVRWQAAP
jgi:hypothetical protein